MAAIVIVHGAFGGGWEWREVASLAARAGPRGLHAVPHRLRRASAPGDARDGLETHIQDIVNLIRYEDLHDVVLAGQSYGGMVSTGVADRDAGAARAPRLSQRAGTGGRPIGLRPLAG